MANLKACLARRIIGMRFTSHSAALLAGEAIAVEHKRTRFFGNRPFKCRNRFGGVENVFSGFQFAKVIMCQDLKALFITQLSNPAAPFAYVARGGAQLIGIQFDPDVCKKIVTQFGACALGFFQFPSRPGNAHKRRVFSFCERDCILDPLPQRQCNGWRKCIANLTISIGLLA